MKIVVLILSILSLIMGLWVVFKSESSIHEIEALILFVISSILFSSYAISNAINLLSSKIEKSLPLKQEKP
jgi:hypothetical protein